MEKRQQNKQDILIITGREKLLRYGKCFIGDELSIDSNE